MLRYTPPPEWPENGQSSSSPQRERLGSAESRRLRREGLVPGVLYGAAASRCAISRRRAGAAPGPDRRRRPARDPRRRDRRHRQVARLDPQGVPGRPGPRRRTHVDLQEVRLDRPIHGSGAVHLVGGDDAPGVREGGVLSQPLRELNVEALPLEVPEQLELDVSGMEIGDTLRIADVAVARRRHAPRRSRSPSSPPSPLRRASSSPRSCRGRRGRGGRGRGAAEGEAARGRRRGPGRAGRGRRRPGHRRGVGPGAVVAAPAGLVARPARRRSRQPGPRVRAQPAQRRLRWSWTSSPAGTAAPGAASSPAGSPRCGSAAERLALARSRRPT